MKGARAGLTRALFAATLIGLGVWTLVTADFAPIWSSVPKAVPARGALIWATAAVLLATGAGLLRRRAIGPAAVVLTVALLAWMLAIKVPPIVAAPDVAANWESCGETAVLAAAAWTLFAGAPRDTRRPWWATGATGLRGARSLYGLAMLAFGAAHLAYLKDTAALIPAWLPGHAAWVYLTAATYIAAGVAMLAGVLARPAAALSALQMGVFTVAVWLPRLFVGGSDAVVRGETAISWALTIAGCVVAASGAMQTRA